MVRTIRDLREEGRRIQIGGPCIEIFTFFPPGDASEIREESARFFADPPCLPLSRTTC